MNEKLIRLGETQAKSEGMIKGIERFDIPYFSESENFLMLEIFYKSPSFLIYFL